MPRCARAAGVDGGGSGKYRPRGGIRPISALKPGDWRPSSPRRRPPFACRPLRGFARHPMSSVLPPNSPIAPSPAAPGGGRARPPRRRCGTSVRSAGRRTTRRRPPARACTMENTPQTRKATKSRIGPWYVLQSRNPAAPGHAVGHPAGVRAQGRVKPTSIVRGPTTHQLWRYAGQVKGLSREFGACYSCARRVDKAASICPRLQPPAGTAREPRRLLETADGGEGRGGAAGGALGHHHALLRRAEAAHRR